MTVFTEHTSREGALLLSQDVPLSELLHAGLLRVPLSWQCSFVVVV